jgi:hypothetical protein
MLIVIPAYRPSNELPLLVTNLLRNEPTHDVLVVDDGSGPTHDDVFARTAAAGATVLRTPTAKAPHSRPRFVISSPSAPPGPS